MVDLPLWKIMEFASWDDDIPNIWKVIKFMFQTTSQKKSELVIYQDWWKFSSALSFLVQDSTSVQKFNYSNYSYPRAAKQAQIECSRIVSKSFPCAKKLQFSHDLRQTTAQGWIWTKKDKSRGESSLFTQLDKKSCEEIYIISEDIKMWLTWY